MVALTWVNMTVKFLDFAIHAFSANDSRMRAEFCIMGIRTSSGPRCITRNGGWIARHGWLHAACYPRS
jgi:hypothetical protein